MDHSQIEIPALNSWAYQAKRTHSIKLWTSCCSAPQGGTTQIVNPFPSKLYSHYWHPYTSLKRPCQMPFSWLSFGRYNASAETDYSLTMYIYDICVMQATAELAENVR